MKKNLLLLSLLLLLTGILVEQSLAVTAYPHPVQITQRDGSKLTVIMQGDERVKWAKTIDGYALIYNSHGIYEYAKRDASGDMVPSGVKALDILERTQQDFTFLTSTPKDLVFSQSQVSVMKQVMKTLKSGGPDHVFPTTGSRKLLCILIGFADKAFTKTNTDFQNLFNQVNYIVDGATGSVRDFFAENSYNQLDLTVDVAGPFVANSNSTYYGANDVWGRDLHPRGLVSEAIQKADPTVNFADYDNDGDGSVDGVYVIFAGYGEETGAGSDLIWSHAWEITPITCDGKIISRYSCSPELRGNSGTGLARIGVICHEFGHMLGAPDFYDTNYSNGGQFAGTGNWDLQASGSWNGDWGATPAHSNPYTKIYVYHWSIATLLSSQATITLQNSAEYTNSFYRFNTNTAGEYFLIENRQQVGFDSFIPGHGLMIYHVHKDIEYYFNYNIINASFPQMMYPVCASSTTEPNETPSSYGGINSGGCPYPGTEGKTAFTDATIPSQKSWEGAFTVKPITSIIENNTTKTITLCFMGCPDPNNPAGFTATPVSQTQINLGWVKNAANNPVMIGYSTLPSFGTPDIGTVYSAGDEIPGGGTVLYTGDLTSFHQTGLTTNSHHVYIAWSVLDGNAYSTGLIIDATTFPQSVSESDSLALVGLYNQCDGPNWTMRNNWLTGFVSTWQGVTVESGRVVVLILSSAGLKGPLFEGLSALTDLRILELNWNKLTGSLPESWSGFGKLEAIAILANQLSGNLPESWSTLSNLWSMLLADNKLTGGLPESWSALVSLKEIWLQLNQLTGTLPESWSSLVNLKTLLLDVNKLNGVLPESWSSMVNLKILWLDVNQLTGGLPESWSVLVNLQTILLNNNQLTGSLPESWSSLINLGAIWFQDNQLTGPLPESWSALVNLKHILLSNNQLSGTLPRSWSTLVNLEALEINGNHLTGTLPDNWSSFTNLWRFQLSGNKFTGTLPESWSAFQKLEYFNINSNNLFGKLPISWLALRSLREFFVYENQLSGLPDFSSLTSLEDLRVQNNLLDFGDIEPNIGVLKYGFYYSPQAPIGAADTILKNSGEEFRISVNVGGNSNKYQWYKNGNLITGATATEFVIPYVTTGDAAIYTCQITNTVATELTLTSQPVTLQISTIQQSKLLSAGWTWFSLNVEDPDMTIGNVLKSLKPNQLDYIKNQTVSATYYSGTGWFGDLTRIDSKEMYKIKLATEDTLKFEGAPVNPLSNPITIKSGWNWIGYIPQTAKAITEALSTLVPVADDYIKNQTVSGTYYDGTGWFGYLNSLEPLDGYMLRSSHAGTLTYPVNGTPLLTRSDQRKTVGTHICVLDERQKTEDFQTVRPEAFEYSGQVTATVYLNGQNFESEDFCLYSVVKGQVRGVSRGMWFEPGQLWIHNHLTYSNLEVGDTIRFRLFDASSDTWYEFKEFAVFKADMLIANALDPFVLKNSSLLAPWVLSPEPSLSVWPNPASYHATIKYIITTDQPVVIQVIDFSGRVIQQMELGNQPAGNHLELWNTETLEQGVYYLRLKGEQSVYKRMVITR